MPRPSLHHHRDCVYSSIESAQVAAAREGTSLCFSPGILLITLAFFLITPMDRCSLSLSLARIRLENLLS